MADRLKIEGNFLVLFEDGNPLNEYISSPKAVTIARFPDSSNVQFYQYFPKGRR